MQQKVVLLDELGERWGQTHVYHNLRSPAEALKLLFINYPDFKDYVSTSHESGVHYTVVQADEYLGLEDLCLPLGKQDLIIAPVITGSSGGGNPFKGIGKVLLGAAIIGVVALTGGFGAGAAAGFAGGFGGATIAGISIGKIAGAIGVSLILGGISEAIAPQPQQPTNAGADRFRSGDFLATDGPQGVTRGVDGRQSYAYSGAANTIGVGSAIPVVYGEALIGSHLISAKVQVSDESDPLMTAIKQPGVDTVRIGGEKVNFTLKALNGLKTKRWNRKNKGTYSDNGPWMVNKKITPTPGKVTGLGKTIIVGERGHHSFKAQPNTKLQVVLGLVDGLYQYASGKNTTLVDGFITYRVEIFDNGGNKQLVGSVQATIQGLLKDNQNYKWLHEFKTGKGPDPKYDVKLTIIDSDCVSDNKLYWYGMGYNIKTS